MLLRACARSLRRRWRSASIAAAAAFLAGLLFAPGAPLVWRQETRLSLRPADLSDPAPWPPSRALDLLRRAGGDARLEKDGGALVLATEAASPSSAAAAAGSIVDAFRSAARADREARLDALAADLGRPRSGPPAPTPEALAARRRLDALEAAQAACRLELQALNAEVERAAARIERGDAGPPRPVRTAESDRLTAELERAERDPAQQARARELRELRDRALSRESLEARFAPLRELLDQARDLAARRDALARTQEAREAEIAGLREKAAPEQGPAVTALPDPSRALAALEARRGKDPVERVDARPARLASAPLLWMLAAALGLGLVLAVALESLSPGIRTEADVQRTVNLPLLGAIPRVRDAAARVVTVDDPRAPLAESWRATASVAERLLRDRQAKVLAVTSAAAGEGKSTTACNLALSLSRFGWKVLLVDADLRRPSQHELLLLPNEAGLSTYLLGGTDSLDGLILGTLAESLVVLTAGPALDAPFPYLRSERFRALIASLRESYDLVILDLPPALGAAEALQAAPVADATLLVVSGRTGRKDEVTAAKRLLRGSGAKLEACLLAQAVLPDRSYAVYAETPAA
jgi:capsular exopolysaccharide synthesis family protein